MDSFARVDKLNHADVNNQKSADGLPSSLITSLNMDPPGYVRKSSEIVGNQTRTPTHQNINPYVPLLASKVDDHFTTQGKSERNINEAYWALRQNPKLQNNNLYRG